MEHRPDSDTPPARGPSNRTRYLVATIIILVVTVSSIGDVVRGDHRQLVPSGILSFAIVVVVHAPVRLPKRS